MDALVEIRAPAPTNPCALAKTPRGATLSKRQAVRSDPCGEGCGGLDLRGWWEWIA